MGGNLRTLKIGFAAALGNGDLLSTVTVGGDLTTTLVTGNVYADINVGGSVRTITMDQLFSDITIAGDLTRITAEGSFFLRDSARSILG